MSCRVYSSVKGIHQVTLLGHRSTVCACFFEKQSLTVSQGHTHHAELVIQYQFYYSLHYYYFVLLLLLLILQLYTVSKDGAVIVWEPSKSAEEIEEYFTNEGNKEEEQEEGTRGREDEADSSDNEEETGEGRERERGGVDGR